MEKRTRNDGHELTDKIIYGPVTSRRYGNSLGINFLPPSKKICSFNCIYCQLGRSDSTDNVLAEQFPSLHKIRFELENNLLDHLKIDIQNIVISGNGEPTLHPKFCKIIERIMTIRDRNIRRIPIICFTNGSTLSNENIRHALSFVDECSVKLDAGLSKIDLPCNDFNLDQTLDHMKKMENLVVQSCFIDEKISNTKSDDIKKWMQWLTKACPRRVDLYTVSRQTAAPGLKPIPLQTLYKIADLLRKNGFKSIRVCH